MIGNEARLFLIALQFLTRLRVAPSGELPADWLARSAKYMPLVGALIGAIVGGVILLSAMIFPEPLPMLIGLTAAIALTGALHEDGLADTADALGGGTTRERCLEIMKDSRIGTFGTLALIVALGLKAAALSPLDPLSMARVLIAAHAGARLATILTLWALPYAPGPDAKVARTPSTMTVPEVSMAIALGLIPGLLVLQSVTFLISMMFACLPAALMARAAYRKIGGYTGDILGAVEQIYEVAFVMSAAAVIVGPG